MLNYEVSSVKKVEAPDETAAVKLRGYVDILIDGCFAVKGIKVKESQYGLFIEMPNKKGNDGKYYDICHCINAESRKELVDGILEAYNK